MSEQKKNRVRLQVVVKPESKDRLKKLCAAHGGVSEGKMLDVAIAQVIPSDKDFK